VRFFIFYEQRQRKSENLKGLKEIIYREKGIEIGKKLDNCEVAEDFPSVYIFLLHSYSEIYILNFFSVFFIGKRKSIE